MRTSIRYSTISRISGAVAAVWACGGGPAWAGDADLAGLQALIGPPDGSTGLCAIFGMNPCPQLPTAAQAVLEITALGNNLPEMVRAQDNTPPENSITAGNPAVATTPPTVSELLSTLTPLAFVSQSSGTAQPTQLFDPTADAFLYAVAVGAPESTLPDPETILFFYDDLFRTNTNFALGTTVAKFSFPLTVLNRDGTERAVPTTLNFKATAAGDCSMSTVVGNFNGNAMGTTQSLSPDQLGINCLVVFGGSPTGTQKHATFEVSIPLLITGACEPKATCTPSPNTDPAYFWSYFHPPLPGPQRNPVNTGVYTAFFFNDSGQSANSGNLGPNGVSIGLAPTAGPLGPPPAAGTAPTYALCASLPVNTNGTSAQLRPAVGAYYAIATSGETFLTAPFPAAVAANGGTPPVCPAFP